MDEARLLHLLQWSDSALPVGGFAHSHGLETLVHSGRVVNIEDLRQVLLAQAVALGGTELIALWYVARSPMPEAAFVPARDHLLAVLWPQEAREASAALGRRLLDVGERLAERTCLERQPGEVFLAGPVAGLLARHLGFTPQAMARSFLYGHVAQSAAAAVRLLRLDPLEVQAIVWGLAEGLADISARAEHTRLRDMGHAAWELEVAQMRHPQDLLRLFRS